MGTNEPLDDEYQPWRSSPAHPVYLDAYYIDRYEVTQAAYAEFLNALPTIYDACGGYDCNSGGVGVDDETGAFVPREENWPVAGLSWENADAYCRWRGKRLPTEAEWEKAARGTDGRRYPWGDEEREKVFDKIWGPYDSFVFLDVGSVPEDVSPYGVWDVLGSVSEWTADWYDPNYYVYSPSHNPSGPSEGKTSEGKARVVRSHSSGSLDRLREGIIWRRTSGLHVGIRCAYSPSSTP
jgi:formylglycine-generating enzyme required for sulfatase activity